jgi:hypothetical protein
MGFRYYTTVTFPVAAMTIEEIAEAVKENYGLAGYERDLEDDGSDSGLVVVSDGQANYGDMSDITSVLSDFEVPHDIHHSESEGSNSIPWTEYVRFDGTSAERDETEEASAYFARQALQLIDKGDLNGAVARLRKEASKAPPPMPDEWGPDLAVVAQVREGYES